MVETEREVPLQYILGGQMYSILYVVGALAKHVGIHPPREGKARKNENATKKKEKMKKWWRWWDPLVLFDAWIEEMTGLF
jgi:hypothetical protein